MSDALLLALIVYAAAGLVVSLVVHGLSFAGIQAGGEVLFFAIHIGILPLWVWIAVTFRGTWSGPSDAWTAIFAGCPAWMKYMTYGFFAYALVNFALFAATVQFGKPLEAGPALGWRGFSGHWMVFYSAGLAAVTTVYRQGIRKLSPLPKCPKGHSVAYGDRFCPECGAPIAGYRR